MYSWVATACFELLKWAARMHYFFAIGAILLNNTCMLPARVAKPQRGNNSKLARHATAVVGLQNVHSTTFTEIKAPKYYTHVTQHSGSVTSKICEHFCVILRKRRLYDMLVFVWFFSNVTNNETIHRFVFVAIRIAISTGTLPSKCSYHDYRRLWTSLVSIQK